MSESSKVFVGNLSYNCREEDLHELFGEFGQVDEAVVIKDRDTGRSRGFAFVTFSSETDANSAIGKLHETDFLQRNITVRKAENKRSGGYGGGNGDGRQGGGYGGSRYGGGRRDRNYDDRSDGYGGGGGHGQRRGYNDRENY